MYSIASGFYPDGYETLEKCKWDPSFWNRYTIQPNAVVAMALDLFVIVNKCLETITLVYQIKAEMYSGKGIYTFYVLYQRIITVTLINELLLSRFFFLSHILSSLWWSIRLVNVVIHPIIKSNERTSQPAVIMPILQLFHKKISDCLISVLNSVILLELESFHS